MRRVTACLVCFVLLVGSLVVVSPALADPPDLLKSYRFLPRLSTLHETGGIAGVNWRFPVFGTYDFVTGYRYESGVETDAMFIRPYAQFENVKAYGAHPLLDPGLSLDRVLNLSGLDGKPIYHGPAGLELFRFEGFVEPIVADEGAYATRVTLLAARLGRWMYLRGHTEAPCCDFFEYELRGVARELPLADWDDDGIVDTADLGQWRAGYGAGLTGRDFLQWQRQYGEQPPSLSAFDTLMNEALVAASTAAPISVPEPMGACLLTVGVICCGGLRRGCQQGVRDV